MLKVRDIMTANVYTVEASALSAAVGMVERQIHRVVAMGENFKMAGS